MTKVREAMPAGHYSMKYAVFIWTLLGFGEWCCNEDPNAGEQEVPTEIFTSQDEETN